MELNYSTISIAVVVLVMLATIGRMIWSVGREAVNEGIAEAKAEMAADKAAREERAQSEADDLLREVVEFTPDERRGILLQAMFREFLFHGPIGALDWKPATRHWLITWRLPADKVDDARQALEREWGIDGPATLREKFDWLLTEGHRGQIDEIFDYADLPEDVVAAHLKKVGREVVGVARAARERVGDARGNAFDIARAAMLAVNGAAVGYLSTDEARELLADCDEDARRWCESWRQFGESFIAGSEIWLKLAGVGFAGLQRRTIDWLLADPLSPWLSEPWGEPLSGDDDDVPAGATLH